MGRNAKLEDIETNLFVRKSLDEDWALELALLLQNGVKLKPIQVTENRFYPDIKKKWLMVDGRHRVEAHQLENIDEISIEVVDIKDELDLISKAYKANQGGSLPPRKEDTEHTVRLLLERDGTIKNIADLLGLPVGIARKYVNEVKARDKRAKLMRAAEAVTDGGLNRAQAAEKYGVEEEDLREQLGGRTRKHKKGMEEIERALTTQYRSHSQKISKLLGSLRDKYDDGDVNARQVNAVFERLSRADKKLTRNIGQWKARFSGVNPGEKRQNGAGTAHNATE